MTTEKQKESADDAHRLGSGVRGMMVLYMVVGAAALGLAVFLAGWEHFVKSFLVAYAYFLSISLGALFFVILQHLTRSGWSVTVRRLAEVLAWNLLPMAILFIVVIVGMDTLYAWADRETTDPMILGKRPWLEQGFFVIRVAVYFGIWILLSRFYLRNSVKQDETGDPELTRRMQARSPIAMVLYGVTVTLFAFDVLMSLDPHWYSTIFGVYYFSGAILAFFAGLIVLVWFLQRMGHLTREVTTEHYHDLGKQLFGYVVFWAYIAFSQYMLIWYANIPEETGWFLTRQTGGWDAVGYLLVFGHFLLPFLLLLPRKVKRVPALLAGLAVWLLLMHYVDLYWLLVPHHGEAFHFGIADVLALIGVGGLYKAAAAHRLSGVSLLASKDPRLPESLAFENI